MRWDDWLSKCDALLALMTDGQLTDDYPYDWRAAYEWGELPQNAVMGAIMRCTNDDDGGTMVS